VKNTELQYPLLLNFPQKNYTPGTETLSVIKVGTKPVVVEMYRPTLY